MKISVISGGTASNELVSMFNTLAQEEVSYILPVSDNGGSTAELIRVLSGPAVGDIRSRLTRLIPEDENEPESIALKTLLSYRLSGDAEIAKHEWLTIVDGKNQLWDKIEPSCKEMIRSFLIHVHMELLKRSRQNGRNFKFELASVGNLFLTGGRLFCGSLDSAIELFLRLTRVSKDIKVLPCLNTNFTYHISALLENGHIVTGQSQISHPSADETNNSNSNNEEEFSSSALKQQIPHTVKTQSSTSLSKMMNHPMMLNNNASRSSINDDLLINRFDEILDLEEYATPSYIHPDLKKSNLHFNKNDQIPLPSPIQRIFYISPYGEEIFPMAHTRVLKALADSEVIVYSIGSLMTSTIPILILQGIGNALLSSSSKSKKKVLLLNGTQDRETQGMTASDFVKFIVEAIEYSRRLEKRHFLSQQDIEALDWSKYVTHLVHLREHNDIELDFETLREKGVKCVSVENDGSDGIKYDLNDLESNLSKIFSSSS